jgi:ribosomal protein S6--L-glutamate ligase
VAGGFGEDLAGGANDFLGPLLVVEYIAARVDFPDIDIRQRLTVSRGYGVSEILIRKGSNFDGKTITETRLRDSDINVLTLYRGSSVIPNPRNERKLESGDRLLCFGKLDAMRGLLPPKSQRRRQPAVKDLKPSAAA